METHAHHLHNAPGKKFLHYLFEFFMLFLAVFCGFMVENYREHRIEKERENIYIQNLYEDLKRDTAIYSMYLLNCTGYLNKMDSAITLMSRPDCDSNAHLIYFLFRTSTLMPAAVFPNERTFDQMKSSGTLRLISKRQVADSISNYYNSLKGLYIQNDIIQARLGDYMMAVGKVLDAKVLYSILKTRTVPEPGSVKFLSRDPIAVNELLTRAQYFYGSRMLQKIWAGEKADRAVRLIKLIKKNYAFE